MFRENVLIALTILITILALSFVILMSVYLQLHELDQKYEVFQKILREQEDREVAEVQKKPEPKVKIESFWNENEDEEDNSNGLPPIYGRIVIKSAPEPDPTTQKNYPPFGFQDEEKPPDAIKFPFHFYRDTGHASVEFPNKVDTSDDIFTRVIKQIQEYQLSKKIQEIENRYKSFSKGIFGGPWIRANTDDGYVWFKRDQLKMKEEPNMTNMTVEQKHIEN